MVAVILLFMAVGLFLILGALFNWGWIYAAWDALAISSLLGEAAARWFCGLIGTALVGMGAYYLLTR